MCRPENAKTILNGQEVPRGLILQALDGMDYIYRCKWCGCAVDELAGVTRCPNGHPRDEAPWDRARAKRKAQRIHAR